MRADAKKNYEHLLAVARAVVIKDGADASLRDIARQAGVGLGTLYRHFPTREALLEALLRASFDELTLRAAKLATLDSPEDALVSWLRETVAVAHAYRGVVASMMAAIADADSALHASCVTMRAAGPRLLARAEGMFYYSNDNREILDGTAGLWCCNAGHGRREIVEAIQRQAAVMDFAPTSRRSRRAPIISSG